MMSDNNVIIEGFTLAGYRSFGEEIQRFDKFSKINLFIGKNNCGKSNLLRFVSDIFPRLTHGDSIKFDKLDSHKTSNAEFVFGYPRYFKKDEDGKYVTFREEIKKKVQKGYISEDSFNSIIRLFKEKSKLDNGILDSEFVWFEFDNNLNPLVPPWQKAFDSIGDYYIRELWGHLSGASGGSKNEHWIPETIYKLKPQFQSINTALIPAIRKVGAKGTISSDFSGEGIIERLVKLQNPNLDHREDRVKFEYINDFLQNVTDNDNATIEIPHDKETILVHMDGKTLPLESLGTGIHEVIILASAATTLENTVICMEEPELHLNPILQKKLVRYLLNSTKNQYFITTHSAALMDTPEAEIYHINLEDNQSKSYRVTSDKHKAEVCKDLGYHPSDLLQSNCVIWVEGPSDRIYINYWIRSQAPELTEGLHYSIMFYGGKLAYHLSGNDTDEIIEDFISLRRLNRNSIIVIDSDRDKKYSRINQTKSRLKEEFNSGPGHAWITEGREIENYLPVAHVKEAICNTQKSAKCFSRFRKYDNTLSIKTTKGKIGQASKVGAARYITQKMTADLNRLDLKTQVNKLISFIKQSNPSLRINS
jgi:AAA15 family ATPase/GTPase/cell fate (sporulation/competence/biofilm development) regulator YlbF (YheA/YmcA/DUF963 family)